MEAPAFLRGGRGRGGIVHDGIGGRGRPHSRNKHWSSQDGGSRSHTPNNVDNERWERGGHRGGGRGRGHSRGAAPKFHNVSLRLNNTRHHVPAPEVPSRLEQPQEDGDDGDTLADIDQDMDSEDDGSGHLIQEPELDSQEERDKFYQEVYSRPALVIQNPHIRFSWSKHAKPKGRKRSQKAKWMILSYLNAWKML